MVSLISCYTTQESFPKAFQYPQKNSELFENRGFVILTRLGCVILVKSLQRCEKWILRKILHRYSDSNFFSTFFFRSKKIFFEKMFIDFFLVRKFFFLTKKNIFSPFSKKYFSFSKIIFFRPKKKVEKIFESLYRCKIFRRIHFSHPWSDLTSLNGFFGHLKTISLF